MSLPGGKQGRTDQPSSRVGGRREQISLPAEEQEEGKNRSASTREVGGCGEQISPPPVGQEAGENRPASTMGFGGRGEQMSLPVGQEARKNRQITSTMGWRQWRTDQPPPRGLEAEEISKRKAVRNRLEASQWGRRQGNIRVVMEETCLACLVPLSSSASKLLEDFLFPLSFSHTLLFLANNKLCNTITGLTLCFSRKNRLNLGSHSQSIPQNLESKPQIFRKLPSFLKKLNWQLIKPVFKAISGQF